MRAVSAAVTASVSSLESVQDLHSSPIVMTLSNCSFASCASKVTGFARVTSLCVEADYSNSMSHDCVAEVGDGADKGALPYEGAIVGVDYR